MAHVRAVACALCCTTASAGVAAERRQVRFEVTRSPDASDCPDAQALTAVVARIAGPDERDTPEPVPVEVGFARSEAGYVATVRAGTSGSERTLASQGSSCSALAEAVAVAVTIMLDGMEDDASTDAEEATTAAPALPSLLPLPLPTPPPAVHGRPVVDNTYDDELPARTAPNIVFAEFLGSALSYSLNYERFFGDDASLRVGFGYFRGNDSEWSPQTRAFVNHKHTQLSLPVLANYYFLGRPNHNMHLAAGATIRYRTGLLEDSWGNPANLGYSSDSGPTVGFNMLVNVVIGYRYVPRAGGFTFGTDFMLLFNTTGVLPWLGVNAGAVF